MQGQGDDQHVPFGELLRLYRGAGSLTQEELAGRVGLSTDAVSMLERGIRQKPRPSTLIRLAEALDLDADQRSAFFLAARRRSRSQAPPSPDGAGAPAL